MERRIIVCSVEISFTRTTVFGTTGPVNQQPLYSMLTYQTRDTQQLIDNFRYMDLPR